MWQNTLTGDKYFKSKEASEIYVLLDEFGVTRQIFLTVKAFKLEE